MNTEQLKTKEEILDKYANEIGNYKDFRGILVAYKLCMDDPNRIDWVVDKAMQDFASQESKRAVEKDRESRWITDRLPDDKLHVNVAFKWGNNPIRVKYALFLKKDQFERENMFVIDGGFFTQDKIAGWQPLPEASKL